MHHQRTRGGMSAGAARLSRRSGGGTPVWLSALVAFLLLIVAGVGYRVSASRLQGYSVGLVRLPIPLSAVPMQVNGWVGQDIEIPEVTEIYLKRNFADDYVSRRYLNAGQGLGADVYVVYCSSKPGGILGHQPLKCFPAHGWIHDSTTPSQIVSYSSRPINCLIHHFHRPAPSYQQVVVLSFYVLNGQITLTEREFSGVWGRRPNLSGDPARYVAQVQISAGLEHSVRAAAAALTDMILTFLPDRDGRVRATGREGEFAPTTEAAENSQ